MTEMTPLPKVAIITLNWRNYKDTIDCLDSLLKQEYPYFQIFVLDNGSHDGSVEHIEEWGQKLGSDFSSVHAENAEPLSFNQRVILLKSEENLGYTGGNNLACQVALKTGDQYLWFIYYDTVQDSGALRALVNTAESDIKVGMVGSKILYFDKPDVIESIGSTLIVPIGVFRHIKQGVKNSDVLPAPIEVPYIYGCSFLVRGELIRDVGLLDERFFLLIEEGDWSLRARKRGWKLFSSPASVVWHKVTSSMGKRSEIFFYYVTRNTLLFMWKHYPIFMPLTALSMLFLISGLIFVDNFFSMRKNLFRKLKMMALGYIHFFGQRFGKAI